MSERTLHDLLYELTRNQRGRSKSNKYLKKFQDEPESFRDWWQELTQMAT